MVDQILIYWILLFIIFLIVNVAGDSTTFGIIAGFWLIILGLAILITGIQQQTGMLIESGSITYVYEDVVLPFGTYAFIWGITLICVSMYMIVANAMSRE